MTTGRLACRVIRVQFSQFHPSAILLLVAGESFTSPIYLPHFFCYHQFSTVVSQILDVRHYSSPCFALGSHEGITFCCCSFVCFHRCFFFVFRLFGCAGECVRRFARACCCASIRFTTRADYGGLITLR